MYNIIESKKNNRSLYTVIYSYGKLTIPLLQSREVEDCVEYINSQPQENNEYNEEEAQQALNSCLSEMYKKNSNPD